MSAFVSLVVKAMFKWCIILFVYQILGTIALGGAIMLYVIAESMITQESISVIISALNGGNELEFFVNFYNRIVSNLPLNDVSDMIFTTGPLQGLGLFFGYTANLQQPQPTSEQIYSILFYTVAISSIACLIFDALTSISGALLNFKDDIVVKLICKVYAFLLSVFFALSSYSMASDIVCIIKYCAKNPIVEAGVLCLTTVFFTYLNKVIKKNKFLKFVVNALFVVGGTLLVNYLSTRFNKNYIDVITAFFIMAIYYFILWLANTCLKNNGKKK